MDPLRVNDNLIIPGWELWFTASRAGGAGGQHVNKTSTRVSLHWALAKSSVLDEDLKARLRRRLHHRLDQDGVLVVNVEDSRSQHRNIEIARERLAEMIVEALKRPKRRRPTKPSRASQRRRVDAKVRRGAIKQLRKNPSRDD